MSTERGPCLCSDSCLNTPRHRENIYSKSTVTTIRFLWNMGLFCGQKVFLMFVNKTWDILSVLEMEMSLSVTTGKNKLHCIKIPRCSNLTTLRQKDKNHSPDTPHQRKWDQTEKTIFFYWWLVKNNFRSLNLGWNICWSYQNYYNSGAVSDF